MWASVDATGLERFQLAHTAEAWLLRGTILRVHAGHAMEVRYRITCNSCWQTINARVDLHVGSESRTLILENLEGSWTANGDEVNQFDGCRDVDLGWTPSTNTLAIRRLDLARRNGREAVDAAWIRFPDLTLERLDQVYEFLGDRTYRYMSRGGTFKAEIVVDESGVVDEYKGYWKRVT
jgi:uncharacterized protein